MIQLAFICLTLLASGVAMAGSRAITCYSDVFPPYVTQEAKGGPVGGIDVETIAAAAQRVGLSVSFKIMPWLRLENELAAGGGEVECAFAYTINESRKTYLDFTTIPLKHTVLNFFARRGTFGHYRGLDDIKGTIIGVRRGFQLPTALEAMVTKGEIKVDSGDKDISGFLKLDAGRVDLVLSNLDVGMVALRQLGLPPIDALNPPIQSSPTFVVFTKSKNMLELVRLFDSGLKQVIADGTQKAIRMRYLGP